MDKNNVEVFLRVRPRNERELNKGSPSIVDVDGKKCLVSLSGTTQHNFQFDHVGGEEITQDEVFHKVGKPISQAFLAGFNGTIFAYGQTGSGKTFTIMGGGDANGVSRGLLPRVLDYVFALTQKQQAASENKIEFSFKVSFLEIYQENIFDLLVPSSSCLKLKDSRQSGVYVDGITENQIASSKEAIDIMEAGIQKRHVRSTLMNRESSRSHSVFSLVLESEERSVDGILTRKSARFNVIDLAGSERQKSTNAEGACLKEASSINKSLFTLTNVLTALVDNQAGKQRHVPYRDSKLTFLLRDSLGGNSKTFIVCNVSPAHDCFAETLSTLNVTLPSLLPPFSTSSPPTRLLPLLYFASVTLTL